MNYLSFSTITTMSKFFRLCLASNVNSIRIIGMVRIMSIIGDISCEAPLSMNLFMHLYKQYDYN